MTRPYRDDIDWLRAVAVLSVCLFHWDVPSFGGGYVGVDIFFVISGFLITQIIQSQARSETFSFAQFYERRVRRLLPALYVVALLTAIPSLYLMLPDERQDLFKSIVATVTFTSNVFFWNQSGYFDSSADEKPMLHTWSLSVEEQFYLVLPIIIVLLYRSATQRSLRLSAGLGALALASFAYAVWLMKGGSDTTAFFLSPPRAWEFLLGSLIAIEGMPVLRNIHLQRSGQLIGLGMIAGAVFGYRLRTSFPGVTALLPCAGAAIYLWSGIAARTVPQRFTFMRVPGFFGRISYSLYLWHWPVVVYAKFLKPNLLLTGSEKGLLAIFAIGMSYLSYRFVEQPFRNRSIAPTRRQAFVWTGAATAALILASAIGVLTAPLFEDAFVKDLRTDHARHPEELYGAGPCFLYNSSMAFDGRNCLKSGSGKANIVVWGDSLAAHYIPGLAGGLDERKFHVMSATGGECFASLDSALGGGSLCRGIPEAMSRLIESCKPDLVIISGAWTLYAKRFGMNRVVANLQQTAQTLRSRGIPLLVLGPTIEYPGSLPSMLLRLHIRGATPVSDQLVMRSIFDLDAQMKAELASQPGLTYLSILEAACPQKQCPVTLPDGKLLVLDNRHLTLEGSRYMANFIAPVVQRIISAQPGTH